MARTVYSRDHRGRWRRNGKPAKTVPDRVLKLAQNMALECQITDRPPRKVRQGTLVAREILTGDIQAAREIMGGRSHWSVGEARAIVAACRVASEKFGAKIDRSTFGL